jgi:Fe-S oxidoreductase/nitrate reductase gamma subunit
MSLQEFWALQEIYISDVFLPVLVAVLLLVPILAAVWAGGLWRRVRLWQIGKPDKRSDNWASRLKTTLGVALIHLRTIQTNEKYPGIMHLLIFWGSVLLVLGKIVRLFGYTVELTNPPQAVFLYASWASEAGGAFILIGGLMAVYRRYVTRPLRLDTKPDDTLIFIWVFLIILTGFMIKGYRIASSEVGPPSDWLMWSPVGYWFSFIFPTFMTEARNEILVWHRVIIHTVPAVIFLGYFWVNRSRMQHILLTPLNVFFRSLQHKGVLTPINLEAAETFGTPKIEDFTWKQLMDLDACVRCGRCQDACPAYFSGKKLNPKQVIQDLKDHMWEVYPIPFSNKPAGSRQDMISEAVTEEVIWDCTTCRACDETCPIFVEHVDKIVDMRRNLAMERSSFPESAQDALKSLNTRFHPWRGTTATRMTWTEGMSGIKVLAEDSNIDILYWVGCTAALDERNMKVAQATARILQAAGINFGILGDAEVCCGDPARRMGDEYLFQTLCQQNIETFKSHNVKKIIATCPHCFNTLKYEYPQFGGNYEVVHHTEFIAGLIRDGKIKVTGAAKNAAYHDSCYLGRYNDIYQPPREILRAVGGGGVELPRHGANSFCCGGGGGHMWMEEEPDKRVNNRRIQEVIDTKVDLISTACPYCLIMFEDALKAKGVEETIKAYDLSELVAESLKKET